MQDRRVATQTCVLVVLKFIVSDEGGVAALCTGCCSYQQAGVATCLKNAMSRGFPCAVGT